MKKNKSKGLMLALLSMFIMSCSLPPSGTGSLSFGVIFPSNSNSFSIKAIPKDTETINIKITGEGIPDDSPILENVSKDTAQKDASGNYISAVKIISDIPKGDKTVKVEAVGSDGKILADAEKSVVIKPQNEGNTKLEIELVELEKTLPLTLNFSNYPTDGKTVMAYLKTSDGKTIFKTFNDKVLNFEQIPVGKTSVKAVVFGDKALPIAIGEYDLELTKDNFDFNKSLETPSIPDKMELSFSKSELDPKNPPDVTKIIPQDLTNLLDKAFTNIEGNTAPEIINVNIYVKGKLQTPFLYYYASPGDDITIELITEDKEKDEISYMWGTTTLGKLDEKAFFTSLKENSPKVTITAPSTMGSFYIGVILTDKKSKSKPFVIPMGIY